MTEEQWKTAAELEATLHESSRQATIFQNENYMSDFYGPGMRKLLHDALSSGALIAIDADAWSIKNNDSSEKNFY